ncbi:MAG: sensor histidine kinase [Dehalococcoidia bacterium]
MTIRQRLALWYAVTLVVSLGIFGLLLYLTLQQSLGRQIDDTLALRAVQVETATRVIESPVNGTTIVLPDFDVFSAPDTFVQVANSNGETVARSPSLGRESLPVTAQILAMAQENHFAFSTQVVAGVRLRLFATPLVIHGVSVGILEVATPLAPTNATLQQVRLLLATGSLVMVLFAIAAGWVVSRQALRPVGRISATAEEIADTQDFSRRVGYNGPPDEVGRLAETFNAMLDTVQQAYDRQEQTLLAQQRFVADASHELRTPLTSIQGNAELLSRAPDLDPAERSDALSQIAEEAARLGRLVNDLLTLARTEGDKTPPRQPVDLRSIAETAANHVALLRGDRTLRIAEGPPIWVAGSPDAFQQLTIILLDNAIKYTQPDGCIDVLVTMAQGQGVLQVRDNGQGIAPDDITHVFERFYQGNRARCGDGSGLGLAIASGIAKQHHGSLEVSSTSRHGATFQLVVPLASQETSTGHPPLRPIEQTARGAHESSV